MSNPAGSPLLVGIDVSKRGLDAAASDGRACRFDNDGPGHRAPLAWVRRPARVVVEATGTYGLGLALALHEHPRCEVMVASPRLVKGFAQALAQRSKTDAADARKLAHLLRTNLLPEAHVISDELRPLRDVLRTRLRLVERRVGAVNSVARLLEKVNVRDVADLPELMRLQARCHLAQAELLQAQVKELEKALHPHLVPDDDVQRLLRVPGVGKGGAFTLKLEIDDVARFPSDRDFVSYCRLVPGADNSADRVRHKRSSEGNRYRTTRRPLKLAFSHASVRAIQYYPEIRAWYRRKKRRKPEAVARALVAKEIARIAYHVLRKREDFDGTFKGAVLSRVKQEQWPLLPSPTSLTDG